MLPVAGIDNAFYLTDLKDAIPFNFGDGSYNYQLKNNINQVIPFGLGDWIVDNDAGVVTFYSTVPSDMPPKITFCKYIGLKGLSGGSDKVDRSGDTMTGNLSMSNNKVTDLGTPNLNSDAVNKSYVDAQSALKEDLSNKSTNTSLGTSNSLYPTQNAVKVYVDDQDSLKLNKAGDTMSGPLNMGSQKITDLDSPTLGTDAANKAYVDANAASTYTNATPTPVTLNGILAGSTFLNKTLQEMFDQLLYPYQNPNFTSFTSTLFTTYEVGQNLPSGLQTINYIVSNSSNIKVQPPDVGVPSSNIPGVTFPLNPFTLISPGSFQINIPALTNSATPTSFTVSLQGTNTNLVNFNTSNTFFVRQRVYWGQNSNISLTESDIEALVNSQLRANFSGTFSFPINGYKYFCYPASMGTASTFTDTSNGFPVAMFGTVNIVSVTNIYGVTENYRVHRTLNILGGTINIAIS